MAKETDHFLMDAELEARDHPDRVVIPDSELRSSLRKGSFAKVTIAIKDGPEERFWVSVDDVKRYGESVTYSGLVDNDLAFPWIWELDYGDRLDFEPRHVFETMWPVEQELQLPLAAG